MIVMYLVIAVIVRILLIWYCVSTAKRKGRDKTTAGILALVFGIWAVIGYAIASSKVGNKCPRCNSDTVLRTVLKGEYKDKQFYVCVNYPECKGRIPCGIA
jgi:ssDNA-binding Zn-finger/Zn-ribbon topoisomerase 1